jgi:hypothetical protein
MKTLKLRRGGAIALIVALCSISVAAQSEKYLIRVVPKPKTTSTLKMVQETDLDITVEGGPADSSALPPQMKMLGKTTMGMKLKTTEATKEGHIPLEITYENVNMEMTMNGNPVSNNDASSKLDGKSFTVTYNEKGDIVDVKSAPELQMPEESLKEILRAVLGAGPAAPISVGESATNPLKMALPLPIPSSEPLNMNGSIKTTLLAVEKSGADRIAKLNQVTDASLVSSLNIPTPDGNAIKMDFDMKMSGGGVSQLNLDQGRMKSSDSSINIDGKFGMSSPEGKMITFVVKGTIKVAVTGGN